MREHEAIGAKMGCQNVLLGLLVLLVVTLRDKRARRGSSEPDRSDAHQGVAVEYPALDVKLMAVASGWHTLAALCASSWQMVVNQKLYSAADSSSDQHVPCVAVCISEWA